MVKIYVNAAVVQWCTHSPDLRLVRDKSQTGATGLTNKKKHFLMPLVTSLDEMSFLKSVGQRYWWCFCINTNLTL